MLGKFLTLKYIKLDLTSPVPPPVPGVHAACAGGFPLHGSNSSSRPASGPKV